MKLLLGYLKGYWKLIILALVLAAINQVFSLLDPYIFKHVIDDYVKIFIGKNVAKRSDKINLLKNGATA
mgnify:CR=1 FL=1